MDINMPTNGKMKWTFFCGKFFPRCNSIDKNCLAAAAVAADLLCEDKANAHKSWNKWWHASIISWCSEQCSKVNLVKLVHLNDESFCIFRVYCQCFLNVLTIRKQVILLFPMEGIVTFNRHKKFRFDGFYNSFVVCSLQIKALKGFPR